MHPYLSTTYAEQRYTDILRSVERYRLLRDADVPTPIEVIRLSVGRTIVRIGTLIAGRRRWDAQPLPAAPTALNLAR